MLLWQKQFCRCVLLQECFANGMEMLAYKYCQFLCHNERNKELFAYQVFTNLFTFLSYLSCYFLKGQFFNLKTNTLVSVFSTVFSKDG